MTTTGNLESILSFLEGDAETTVDTSFEASMKIAVAAGSTQSNAFAHIVPGLMAGIANCFVDCLSNEDRAQVYTMAKEMLQNALDAQFLKLEVQP